MLGEGHSDSVRMMEGVSCDKTKACIESNVKQLVAQAFLTSAQPKH